MFTIYQNSTFGLILILEIKCLKVGYFSTFRKKVSSAKNKYVKRRIEELNYG